MKKDVAVDWKRTRVTKLVKVAKIDMNAETRHYYGHMHTLEKVDEELHGIIRVSIELDEIISRIARQAAVNTSGRATAYSGLIIAKRLDYVVKKSDTKTIPISEGYSEVKPDEVKKDV